MGRQRTQGDMVYYYFNNSIVYNISIFAAAVKEAPKTQPGSRSSLTKFVLTIIIRCISSTLKYSISIVATSGLNFSKMSSLSELVKDGNVGEVKALIASCTINLNAKDEVNSH